jgi:hypothetical protein
MPIQFHCSGCGRLLRTGDETAGRQAQCPACGGLSLVPIAGAAAGGFADRADAGRTDHVAARRVAGPANALIAVAILGMVCSLFAIAENLATMFGAVPAKNEPLPPLILAAGVAFGVVGLAIEVLILVGAVQMKRLESYGLAMTAAVFAIIPCYWPCCVLGLPLGIWALVALSDSAVKAAFRS